MKKVNYKLTPQAHKQCIELDRTLPQCFRLYPDGEPRFRKTSKMISGKDIHEVQRKNIKDFGIKNNYTLRSREPLYVNHKLNLIEMWELKGQHGIDEYVKMITEVFERDKDKKIEA